MKKPLIITAPNPILDEVTPEVTSFDFKQGSDLQEKINKIIEVLKSDENGIGLSANQLGINLRICVVEFKDPEEKNTISLQVFINPKIAELGSELETLEEGCLSVPKIELPVERSIKIKIRAQNEKGRKIRLTAKGLFARVIQHEIDHLNGVLFTDRVKEKLLKIHPEIKKLKIVFIGTGDFANLILEGLILLDLNIQKIISEEAKHAGRNQEIVKPPVAKMASRFRKSLIETDNINEISFEILKTKPDLIILADFGQKIPKEILNLPKIAAINIHPSLLPKYRGPSPIQEAILKGEKETGVSIIKMTPEIDKGPVLSQETLEIFDFDNTATLKNRLSSLALKMLLELLPKLQKREIEAKPQDESAASFTKKFTKADGKINWSKPPEQIDCQIRALYPWPGTYTSIDNKRLIIHFAHLENNKLVLDIVQPEGKRPMTWKEFLRGFHGQKPEWFGKIDRN